MRWRNCASVRGAASAAVARGAAAGAPLFCCGLTWTRRRRVGRRRRPPPLILGAGAVGDHQPRHDMADKQTRQHCLGHQAHPAHAPCIPFNHATLRPEIRFKPSPAANPLSIDHRPMPTDAGTSRVTARRFCAAHVASPHAAIGSLLPNANIEIRSGASPLAINSRRTASARTPARACVLVAERPSSACPSTKTSNAALWASQPACALSASAARAPITALPSAKNTRSPTASRSSSCAPVALTMTCCQPDIPPDHSRTEPAPRHRHRSAEPAPRSTSGRSPYRGRLQPRRPACGNRRPPARQRGRVLATSSSCRAARSRTSRLPADGLIVANTAEVACPPAQPPSAKGPLAPDQTAQQTTASPTGSRALLR